MKYWGINLNELIKDTYHFKTFLSILSKREIGIKKLEKMKIV